jgi:hypothetical protein
LYGKYNIILFQNNKKKKLIKKYNSIKNATKKFNDLLKENKNIIFNKEVQNFEGCEFFLGLITSEKKIQSSIFLTDDLGRNIPVSVNNSDYVFLDLKPFKIEETLFDWQTEKKITMVSFLTKYAKTSDLKSITVLNNKICLQQDENFYMFSLKNKEESNRFINILEDYFIENGRSDAIFARDVSIAYRKWIYNILESKGFNKNRLYRLKTTFSKRRS